MKMITHYADVSNDYYNNNALDILPSEGKHEVHYDLLELEIFQVS